MLATPPPIRLHHRTDSVGRGTGRCTPHHHPGGQAKARFTGPQGGFAGPGAPVRTHRGVNPTGMQVLRSAYCTCIRGSYAYVRIRAGTHTYVCGTIRVSRASRFRTRRRKQQPPPPRLPDSDSMVSTPCTAESANRRDNTSLLEPCPAPQRRRGLSSKTPAAASSEPGATAPLGQRPPLRPGPSEPSSPPAFHPVRSCPSESLRVRPLPSESEQARRRGPAGSPARPR
jgi:hypothetical protein